MHLNKVLLKKTFKATLEEYFQKTSLNGFGLLYYIRRRQYQRIFCFISILCGCSFAAYVSFIIVANFIENPTVIALEPLQHRSIRKPLPAVGVCSVNKISRTEAESFAGKLSKLSNYSQSYWLKQLEIFAGYYDDNIVDLDEAIALELQLQKVLGINYNITALLLSLAPLCKDLLVECHFAGKQRNCSDLFKTVPTIIGHCCIFNMREGHVEKNKTQYLIETGVNNGLVLILNASTNDYFYKGRSMNGFLLQTFERHILPDITTGGVKEIMISPGTDTRIELTMVSQAAESQARRFSYLKRRCFFEDESLSQKELATSQPECLSRCRLQRYWSICECVPYYTPQEYLDGMTNTSVCSLMDLECVGNFFLTFHSYRPKESQSFSVMDGLLCEHCYPLCSFNSYNYQKQSTKLKKMLYVRSNRKFLPKLRNNTRDFSIVRLYFEDQFVIQYEKKVLLNWFQILSNIGGVLGISIGCSIISGFEILYFFVYRFGANFLDLRKTQNKA